MVEVNSELIASIRHFYDQYHETKGANAKDIIPLCSEDVSWRSLGGPAAGSEFLVPGTKRENVAAYLDGLFDQWRMDHYTVTDIVAEGDRIIVLSDTKFTFKATGKSVETEKADVWRVRDGQLVEFFELFDTASMRAAVLPD